MCWEGHCGSPGSMQMHFVSYWRPHFCRACLLRLLVLVKNRSWLGSKRKGAVPRPADLVPLVRCPCTSLPSSQVWDPWSQPSLQSDGRPGCQLCLPVMCLISPDLARTVCPSFGTWRLRSVHLFSSLYFIVLFWEAKIMLSFKG